MSMALMIVSRNMMALEQVCLQQDLSSNPHCVRCLRSEMFLLPLS